MNRSRKIMGVGAAGALMALASACHTAGTSPDPEDSSAPCPQNEVGEVTWFASDGPPNCVLEPGTPTFTFDVEKADCEAEAGVSDTYALNGKIGLGCANVVGEEATEEG